jgi:6-phosphogluconate dehydrogenase (decarboxylating)
VDAADLLGVKADIIRRSLEFRKESASNPSYTGQILSALREQFGGHAVT